jgi:hypothetical protein
MRLDCIGLTVIALPCMLYSVDPTLRAGVFGAVDME